MPPSLVKEPQNQGLSVRAYSDDDGASLSPPHHFFPDDQLPLSTPHQPPSASSLSPPSPKDSPQANRWPQALDLANGSLQQQHLYPPSRSASQTTNGKSWGRSQRSAPIERHDVDPMGGDHGTLDRSSRSLTPVNHVPWRRSAHGEQAMAPDSCELKVDVPLALRGWSRFSSSRFSALVEIHAHLSISAWRC